MDSATRLKRHTELWNTGTTQVRQTATSSLILGAILLFNVIEPNATLAEREDALERQAATLAQDVNDLEKLQRTQQQLHEDKVAVESKLEDTKALRRSLDDIEAVISEVPWDRHNRDLQRMFREQAAFDYQDEADATVNRIALQIGTDVVEPFRAATAGADVGNELKAYPKRIEKAIEDWRRGLIGETWWLRVSMKNETVRQVTDLVSGLQAEAEAKVAESRVAVERRIDEIVAEQSALEDRIAAISETKAEKQAEIDAARKELAASKQKLEKALASALPAWAQTLVNVDALVRFFPWALIGVAFFIVARAVIAAQHFHGMADEENWSNDERSDPLASSVWTLTWRENVGTAATIVSYLAVLAGLWYLLGQSLKLHPSEDMPSWIPHAFMALAATAVVFTPFRHRDTGETVG